MTFFLELAAPHPVHVSVEAQSLTEAITMAQWWCLGYALASGSQPTIERADKRSKRGTSPTPLDDVEGMSQVLHPKHFKETLK